MQRWYKGFTCGGIKPQALVEQVAGVVRRNHLSETVPVVRYEKGARGPYYFFLAIESENIGDAPQPVIESLFNLGSLSRPVEGGFKLDEIRRMTTGEIGVYDYARRIHYQPPTTLPEFDPFAAIEHSTSEQSQREEDTLQTTQLYDRLILWMSSASSGTKGAFQRACKSLQLDQDGKQAGRIFRRLRVLGHVESSKDGGKWSIAPSVLVKHLTAEGGNVYFLSGQRDGGMVQKLRSVSDVWEVPQEGGDAPSTLFVRTDSPDELASICSTQIHIDGEVALKLAMLLPDIKAWGNTLEDLPGVMPEMNRLKLYNGVGFIDTFFEGQSGFYQLWPLDQVRGQDYAPRLQLFYDSESKRWLRGDWYGLRYLSLNANGEACPIRYYSKFGRLGVPIDYRWPELYERALVLASGRLPIYNGPWLVYEAITPALLEILIGKLGLQEERSSGNA